MLFSRLSCALPAVTKGAALGRAFARVNRATGSVRQLGGYWGFGIAILVAMAATCSAQSISLSLSSGFGGPGSIVTIRMSLTSSPGAEPASLQWVLNYPAAAVTSFTPAAGSAATAAGKSIVCSGARCLLYGLNAQSIQDGVVATFTFQLANTVSGDMPLQLSDTLAASALSDSISINSVGGSIFSHVTPTGALAQVAVNGNLVTGIFVLNTGAAPAPFSIHFFDDNGNPVALPFTTGSTSLLTGTLPAQGSAYYEADSVQPGPVAGWGQIVADPNIVIQALFRNHVNGTYYEAAVPSTPGGREFLIPFDATTFATTGQPFVTGVAIANLDDSAIANVTCTARYANGLIIPNAVTVPALPPSGHWANYQFPGLNGQRGTIDCVSNTNISATALRFLDSALSSLPVVTNPAGAGGSTKTGAVAQVAWGGTLTTGIFVLNTGAAPAPFSLQFFDDKGNPAALPFTTGSTSLLTGTLPAQGSAYYEAGDPQIATMQGWGQISSASSVVIQALFRNNVGGIYYEAAVPSTPGSKEFLIPFDATIFATTGQAFVIGFAVANLDNSAVANVTCTARDPSGLIIPNAVPVPALPPSGHWAGYQFPALNGQRGTIDCVSNTSLSATALRFLGNALSSLPVVTK